MKKLLLFVTLAIMCTAFSCLSTSEKANGKTTSDYCSYMKNLWNEHKEDLETCAKEMREQGIEFFINGVPLKIENDRNKPVTNVVYSDAMRTVVALCKSKKLSSQFGWYNGKEPFFSNGAGYFYVSSQDFADEYGDTVSLHLIYSDYSADEVNPFTQFEDLGGGWLLIKEHIGE